MTRSRASSLVLVLSFVLLAVGSGSVMAQSDGDDASAATTAADAASDHAAKLAILEAYVEALVDGDFSDVPMTDDVTFQNPFQSEPISGADTVQSYEEENFSKAIDGVQDGVSYIIDGDEATVIFVLEMSKGFLVPTADYFRFDHGKISMIRPYFDTALFASGPADGS